ncbi:hypothetical protein D3C77_685860 [compost metagenome]
MNGIRQVDATQFRSDMAGQLFYTHVMHSLDDKSVAPCASQAGPSHERPPRALAR